MSFLNTLRSHPFLLPCGTRRALQRLLGSPRSAEWVDCSALRFFHSCLNDSCDRFNVARGAE